MSWETKRAAATVWRFYAGKRYWRAGAEELHQAVAFWRLFNQSRSD